MTIIASRRHFLTGLGLVIAAPAVVRISSLMPVRSITRFEPRILRVGMGWAPDIPDVFPTIQEALRYLKAGDQLWIEAAHVEAADINRASMVAKRVQITNCLISLKDDTMQKCGKGKI